MIYDLLTAWRNLQNRPILSIIPTIVMALAVGLTIAVLALGQAIRQGVITASDPFGVLVIGPKGDGEQLVLNTILLQGLPLGTIPHEIYDALRTDERVRLAVPLASSDNIGGSPIIGTNADFFQLRTAQTAPPAFQLAQGRLFEGEFEVVLGNRAYTSLGLTIGDTFRPAHGVEEGLEDDLHEAIYTIVGILHPSQTPYDNAVFTSLESVWEVHHEEGESESPLVLDVSSADDELTSVLVQPTGFAEQNRLWQEFYTREDAQAVFPGQELGRLFDLLAQAERILTGIAYLVFGIALLTIFLAIYSATINHEYDIAIMRSMGASRGNVFRVVLFEATLIALLGSVLGRVVGYGAGWWIAQQLSAEWLFALPIGILTEIEPTLWLVPMVVALLGALVPATYVYTVDIVAKLRV